MPAVFAGTRVPARRSVSAQAKLATESQSFELCAQGFNEAAFIRGRWPQYSASLNKIYYVMNIVNEKIKRALREFNPFWDTPIKIEHRDRKVYERLRKLINEPQIVSILKKNIPAKAG